MSEMSGSQSLPNSFIQNHIYRIPSFSTVDSAMKYTQQKGTHQANLNKARAPYSLLGRKSLSVGWP